MATTKPPRIIFGAGGIGHTKNSFTFTWETPEAVAQLLTKLKSLGVVELDSAASYPPTNAWHTETLLGESQAANQGFIIDSKVFKPGALNDENITSSVDKTLQLLGTNRIRILYAHEPDPNTPLLETAAALHKQYLSGKIEKVGVSNYSTQQMAEYLTICDEKGYVRPSVYQGHYNALIRGHEEELMPLLRKNGIAYYAFSPLGGGFLTGKVTFAENGGNSLTRTRFVGESAQQYFLNTFDKPELHQALRNLKEVCEEFEASLSEVCLRWLMYHSVLTENDAIIIGAKRLDQLETNVKDCRKGPLPQILLDAVEKMSEGGLRHEGSW